MVHIPYDTVGGGVGGGDGDGDGVTSADVIIVIGPGNRLVCRVVKPQGVPIVVGRSMQQSDPIRSDIDF